MVSKTKSRSVMLAVAVAIASLVDLHLLVGEANAVIGRPLTPMSYAGVARRTTRRTVAVAAATSATPIYW